MVIVCKVNEVQNYILQYFISSVKPLFKRTFHSFISFTALMYYLNLLKHLSVALIMFSWHQNWWELSTPVIPDYRYVTTIISN